MQVFVDEDLRGSSQHDAPPRHRFLDHPPHDDQENGGGGGTTKKQHAGEWYTHQHSPHILMSPH